MTAKECFTTRDLNYRIPQEFHDAQMLPALAEAMNSQPYSVCIHGPPGTGKTRQAWATLRNSRKQRLKSILNREIEIPDAEKTQHHASWVKLRLADDIVTLISESADILRHRFDHAWLDQMGRIEGWLIVDDVGFNPRPSDWAMEAVYVLANERRAHLRPTLWTSNLNPSDIAQSYSPAIASRILGGIVIELDGKDMRRA